MIVKFKADELFKDIANPDYKSLVGKPMIFMDEKVGMITEYSDGYYTANVKIDK